MDDLRRWMGDVELDLSNMDVKREREQELWTEQNDMFYEESQGQT